MRVCQLWSWRSQIYQGPCLSQFRRWHWFLGAFYSRKAPITCVMSVCPHVCARLPLDVFSWNFIMQTFMKICGEIRNLVTIGIKNIGNFRSRPIVAGGMKSSQKRCLRVKWCQAVRIAEEVWTLRERVTMLRYVCCLSWDLPCSGSTDIAGQLIGPLKMAPIDCSETSVRNYCSTLPKILRVQISFASRRKPEVTLPVLFVLKSEVTLLFHPMLNVFSTSPYVPPRCSCVHQSNMPDTCATTL